MTWIQARANARAKELSEQVMEEIPSLRFDTTVISKLVKQLESAVDNQDVPAIIRCTGVIAGISSNLSRISQNIRGKLDGIEELRTMLTQKRLRSTKTRSYGPLTVSEKKKRNEKRDALLKYQKQSYVQMMNEVRTQRSTSKRAGESTVKWNHIDS